MRDLLVEKGPIRETNLTNPNDNSLENFPHTTMIENYQRVKFMIGNGSCTQKSWIKSFAFVVNCLKQLP